MSKMNGNTTVADLFRGAAALMDNENTDTVRLTADIDGRLVEFELRLVGEVKQPKTKGANDGKPASTH